MDFSDGPECPHRDADDNMRCDLCNAVFKDGSEPCRCNHWTNDDDLICDVCGISLVGEVPSGHRDADDNSACDFCGTEYTDYEDIGEDGHTHAYGEWALEDTEGVPCDERHFCKTCWVCGYERVKDSEYGTHSFECVITAPTCSEKGYTTKTCTTCSYSEKYNITNTIAHTLTSVVVEPTCLTAGYTENTCSVCGFSEQVDPKSALGHSFAGAYLYGDTHHWQKCERCEATSDPVEHTSAADGYCAYCDKIVGYTEGVVYDLSSDGTYAEVIDYTGSSERVVIAGEYMGVPVTRIYKEAFQCTGIISVIIPDTVTEIGELAFDGCEKLFDVVIPNGVTEIGPCAFWYCTSLSDIVIPDSVIDIGNYAFYNSGLTDIAIPDSVTSIGASAFESCNLKNITLGLNIAHISADSFRGCAEEVYTIYGNCKYLGNAENPYMVLVSVESRLYSSYTIHEDTVVIASRAFDDCERMGSICIPASVRYIGSNAFSSCSSLTGVTFADPYGWNYIYNKSLYSVSADLLSDPAKAKRYLADSKYSYNWEKIDTAA